MTRKNATRWTGRRICSTVVLLIIVSGGYVMAGQPSPPSREADLRFVYGNDFERFQERGLGPEDAGTWWRWLDELDTGVRDALPRVRDDEDIFRADRGEGETSAIFQRSQRSQRRLLERYPEVVGRLVVLELLEDLAPDPGATAAPSFADEVGGLVFLQLLALFERLAADGEDRAVVEAILDVQETILARHLRGEREGRDTEAREAALVERVAGYFDKRARSPDERQDVAQDFWTAFFMRKALLFRPVSSSRGDASHLGFLSLSVRNVLTDGRRRSATRRSREISATQDDGSIRDFATETSPEDEATDRQMEELIRPGIDRLYRVATSLWPLPGAKDSVPPDTPELWDHVFCDWKRHFMKMADLLRKWWHAVAPLSAPRERTVDPATWSYAAAPTDFKRAVAGLATGETSVGDVRDACLATSLPDVPAEVSRPVYDALEAAVTERAQRSAVAGWLRLLHTRDLAKNNLQQRLERHCEQVVRPRVELEYGQRVRGLQRRLAEPRNGPYWLLVAQVMATTSLFRANIGAPRELVDQVLLEERWFVERLAATPRQRAAIRIPHDLRRWALARESHPLAGVAREHSEDLLREKRDRRLGPASANFASGCDALERTLSARPERLPERLLERHPRASAGVLAAVSADDVADLFVGDASPPDEEGTLTRVRKRGGEAFRELDKAATTLRKSCLAGVRRRAEAVVALNVLPDLGHEEVRHG